MRFSLQDVRKSVQRRSGELYVSLQFLRAGMLHDEIEQLIAYHERLRGQPQRLFVLDTARACIGEYRLANCLNAVLSHWYSWRQREWADVVQEFHGSADLLALASPVQLRLALYSYVNAHYQGFLDSQKREEALQAFAQAYHLSAANLEYLLALDSEDEALLVREAAQPPQAQQVITLYNQWAFEAALFNASSVWFVIDCQAFANVKGDDGRATTTTVESGVGAVIKRLCYMARRLGVYYDLAYDAASSEQGRVKRLTLTLYGPQEVTGAPQQYGLRLARLCRMLLGYGIAGGEARRAVKKPTLSGAVIEAQARVHFLQRSYTFAMDANLLQLLPSVTEPSREVPRTETEPLFDSSIEQAFCEAFRGSARSQGVDGWRLEREPEPLLLEQGIFIPDFALTRDQRRIYVEILGFWTPAYRERKIQRLHQLRGRTDLLLAIPLEAKDAFASIAHDFPIVFYEGQLSVTDVLHMMRSHYDDFAERLAAIDRAAVWERVQREGLLSERQCYSVLHCYRRAEIQQAAERVLHTDEKAAEDITFTAGIGLYQVAWSERVRQSFLCWLSTHCEATLAAAVRELQACWPVLQECEATAIETLLSLWPDVRIRRDSIFDAVVELANAARDSQSVTTEEISGAEVGVQEGEKRPAREKRRPTKKRSTHGPETVQQQDLWG